MLLRIYNIYYRNLTLESTGIIGQHVEAHEHHVLAGQIQKLPAMKTQNTYTLDHHDIEEGTVQVPKDLKLFDCKVHVISLDPRLTWHRRQHMDHIEYKIKDSFKTHPYPDCHNTTIQLTIASTPTYFKQ